MEILERRHMSASKPVAKPWSSRTAFKKCLAKCKDLDVKNYQSLIGALMSLTVISRSDLSHVFSKLS